MLVAGAMIHMYAPSGPAGISVELFSSVIKVQTDVEAGELDEQNRTTYLLHREAADIHLEDGMDIVRRVPFSKFVLQETKL